MAETASFGLANLLQAISNDNKRIEQIVKIIRKYFFQSKTYKRRQLYVLMSSSLFKAEDTNTFEYYFKKDFLTLVDDRVITVRMTLARILTSYPQQKDKEISLALARLSKDSCGDIRELVSSHLSSLSVLSTMSAEMVTADSSSMTPEDSGMTLESPLDHVEIDMNMEIMVEDEMHAAMQQF